VDFLIVHHGLFWGGVQPLTGPVYGASPRCRGNCAVYSSHLPLDAHPEIGNNVLLARQLGLKPRRQFLVHEGEAIGWIAPNKLKRAQLRPPRGALPRVVAIECGSAQPRQVAFCSGSGNSAVPNWSPPASTPSSPANCARSGSTTPRSTGSTSICCGHYATEMLGVKALAAELAKKFRLPWEFIETDNPL
jgi:putative NIF3 family GTP cyclohydrolase 1 type 2